MRLITTFVACVLSGLLYLGVQARAQEDVDLDALLNDLADVSTTDAASSADSATTTNDDLDALLSEANDVGAVESAIPTGEAAEDADAAMASDDLDALLDDAADTAPAATPLAEMNLDDLLEDTSGIESVADAAPAVEESMDDLLDAVSEVEPSTGTRESSAGGTTDVFIEELTEDPVDKALSSVDDTDADDAFAALNVDMNEGDAVIEGTESFTLEDEMLGEGLPSEPPPAEIVAATQADAAMDDEEDRAGALAEQLGVSKEASAKLLAQQELVRKQAQERDARKNLEEGYSALTEKHYARAVELFEKAIQMPVRPVNGEQRERAQFGYAEANYFMAKSAFDSSRKEGYRNRDQLDQALSHLRKALTAKPDHASSLRLKPRLEGILATPVKPLAHRKRPEVVERKKTVKELLAEGKGYMDVGDHDMAEKRFDEALFVDPYSIPASRFLKRLEEIRFKIATKRTAATKAAMVEQVRNAWNPPPSAFGRGIDNLRLTRPQPNQTPNDTLMRKMQDIIIPSLEFRMANIADVINLLVEASRASDPDGTGVNIILHAPGSGGAPASEASQPSSEQPSSDDFGDLFPEFEETVSGGGEPSAGGSDIPRITLNLRRVNLLDAIRYVTEVAGLKYRLDKSAVIITPANMVSGTVITRMYPVQPSIIETIMETVKDTSRGGGGNDFEFGFNADRRTEMKKTDVKTFFEEMGVPFPVGTSITYNPAISKLIVSNIAENHDRLDRVLADINVTPSQIEIEARYVEVVQSDIRELGLEWMLTDNFELAVKDGPGPISSRERVQLDSNAGTGGFTRGLRFFNFSEAGVLPTSAAVSSASDALGNILSFSSVLTNPELNVVLRALDQSGNADILSAPKITTRSGQNATIQVIQEIIYPSEFTSEASSANNYASSTVLDAALELDPDIATSLLGNQNIVIFPDEFETRGVGVILNVTPTVGPDGYTIDLALAPEVAELVDWIQYGTPPQNVPQPIFESRSITTSIDIWDGQTVVLGGLMREDITTVNDRIPILGDIPFLGRLFRNEGESSRKRNLLIFVTARLVRPDGRPLHTSDELMGRSAPLEGTETSTVN